MKSLNFNDESSKFLSFMKQSLRLIQSFMFSALGKQKNATNDIKSHIIVVVWSEKRYSKRMYIEKFHNSSHSIASLNLMDKRSILDTRETWKGGKVVCKSSYIFCGLNRVDFKK